MKHQNLFEHFESKREVYDLLQKDLARDEKRVSVSIAIGSIVLALWLGGALESNGWIWLVAVSFFYGLTMQIDNSNRNFALHVIDWYEADRRRTSSTAVRPGEMHELE